MNELGSLRSWVRDAVLGGVLVPLCVMCTIALIFLARGESMPPTFLDGLVTMSVLGAGIGLVLAAPAFWLARTAWPVPLVAFALGPVLGVLCSLSLMWLVTLAFSDPWPSVNENLRMAALGAFAIGPPWWAYLAVRSRGRTGLPVVFATTVWTSGCIALLIGWAMLTHSL